MCYDGKSGLVDMNARWYNPGTARFMNEYTYQESTGSMNRPMDYKNDNIGAGLNKNSNPPVPAPDNPPVGYIWHHHQDGKTMILVDKDIHREFTHAGGVSVVNGKYNDGRILIW